MRKMASLQVVRDIVPIENADRIETAVVEGWNCVVRKGEFAVGEPVIYFEIDTFLPIDNPHYAFLAERGKKSMIIDGYEAIGHVLKTAKLRGVYSQGLVMSPAELGIDITGRSIGDDLTEECGVLKYEPIGLSPDALGSYDTSVAPRTDATRIQNCVDIFPILKKVTTRASIKVDGMSTTVVNDPRRDAIRVFSHSQELNPETGYGRIIMDCAKAQGILAFCENHPGITVQAELAGPKIGGNMLRLPSFRLFVFAVWNMLDGLAKVSFEDATAFPDDEWDTIRASMCPVIDVNLGRFSDVADVVKWAETLRGNVTKDRLDEGCVFHIMSTDGLDAEELAVLRDALGPTLEVKAINNRYLLKKKE